MTPLQRDVVAGLEELYPRYWNCIDEPVRRGLSIRGRIVFEFRPNGDGTVNVTVHQQHPVEGVEGSLLRAMAHCIGRELAHLRVSQAISSTTRSFFYPFVFNNQ